MVGEAWDVRHEIEGRPTLGAVLGLIVGLTAVTHPFNLIAIGVCCWARTKSFRLSAGFGLVVGLALTPKPATPLQGRSFVTGLASVITSPRHSAYGWSCEVRQSGKIYLLSAPQAPSLELGQTIDLRAVARPLEPDRAALQILGVSGRIVAGPGDIRVVAGAGRLLEVANAIRDSFRSAMRSNLPADAADVAESVVFGADDLMPQDRAAYRQAGAISVMSAAGMQVYLLATIAFWLLRLLPISRPIQLLAISVLLVALVLAGGMHAGAIRACVVLLLSSAAYFFRREPDVLSALALAALFELVLVPYRVYDLGFQTSFLVVTSVVLYVPGMSGYLIAKQGLWPVVRRALVFLFVATFASAPLIAYQSGTFEFANPLASLMIAPAVPFVFSFGLLVWLLTPVSEVIAHGLSAVFLGPLCGWCLAVIETCGRHPLVSLETPVLNGYWLAPYYALLGLGARISSKALRGSVG